MPGYQVFPSSRRVVARQKLFFTVIKADRLRRHDGGNRMLVDKLRLTVAAQQNAEIVKPCDNTLQLNAVDQEDRHRYFRLTHMVKKCVLKVLFIVSHWPRTLYCYWSGCRGNAILFKKLRDYVASKGKLPPPFCAMPSIGVKGVLSAPEIGIK